MKKPMIAVVVALLLSRLAWAESPMLADVQKQWAVANYELKGDEQIKAFEKLIEQTDGYLQQNGADVDLLIWRGIVKSTLAGAKGGLGALSLAKGARADLEKSLDLDAKALSGSAHTSLGTLYHNVPGWPIGFGSDKKARKHFEQALAINPAGIDSNYFYGQFLFDEGKYSEAEKYLLAAQAAPARPNRPLADKGRQQEIGELLQKLEKKLKK